MPPGPAKSYSHGARSSGGRRILARDFGVSSSHGPGEKYLAVSTTAIVYLKKKLYVLVVASACNAIEAHFLSVLVLEHIFLHNRLRIKI